MWFCSRTCQHIFPSTGKKIYKNILRVYEMVSFQVAAKLYAIIECINAKNMLFSPRIGSSRWCNTIRVRFYCILYLNAIHYNGRELL